MIPKLLVDDVRGHKEIRRDEWLRGLQKQAIWASIVRTGPETPG